MRRLGIFASLLTFFALFLVLVAQKMLVEGTAHDVVLWLGVALAVGGAGWRAYERSRAVAAAKPVETALLVAQCGVVLGLALYGLSTDAGLQMIGQDPSADDARLGPMLGVLWPAVLAVSGLALLFMELAYQRMPIAEAVEVRRVYGAAYDGIAIALSFVFVISMVFVANEREERKDLTYFRTSMPSGTTLRMLDSLGEPVHAVLFFSRNNEVETQVQPYFEALDRASDKFDFEVRDHALSPELTRKHRIRGNGFIALLRGEGEGQQAQTIDVGTELEVARSRLRTFDGRFQRAFAQLVMQRRELSLTAGHDERSATGIEGDTPFVRTRDLMDALSRSNITTRPLGMAQGLANEVPDGTVAVAVIGPRKPLLPEEARSLLRYVQHGGRLVAMFDPDEEHGLEPLLHGLGVDAMPGVLASESDYLRRTGTLADRAIVRTSRYSSHPTVTIASRNASQLATVFIHGGALSRYQGEGVLPHITVDFPVRSGDGFFRDLDGDFERGPSEPTETLNMIAAVTVPNHGGEEGRAVLVADGDFVTDQVIRNPGNALVFGDMIQWLIGQEQIVGDVTSEEDERIEHTPEEDRYWFYGTSFGVPLPLFGIAIWVGLRRSRRRRKEEGERGGAKGAKDAEEEKKKAKPKEKQKDGEAKDGGKDAEAEAEAEAKAEKRAAGAVAADGESEAKGFDEGATEVDDRPRGEGVEP